VNYQAIKQRLAISKNFISQTQKKYKERGLAGIKLGYKGSNTYLTDEEKAEKMVGLYPRARRNISELEKYLIETYEGIIIRERLFVNFGAQVTELDKKEIDKIRKKIPRKSKKLMKKLPK
jgi:transposase